MENELNLYFNKKTKIFKNLYLNFNYQVLTDPEKVLLEEKFSKLPYREKILFYMKYIFEETDKNIKEILDYENPDEEIIFLENLLISQLGYENKKIDSKILKKLIENVFCKEQEEDETLEEISHIYSKSFKNKMGSLGLEKPKRKPYTVIKKAALFFIIVTMTLTVFLATNSEAREALKGWLIKTYPEYSTIGLEENQSNVDLRDIKYIFEYLPEDLILTDSNTSKNVITKFYIGTSERNLDITIYNIHEALFNTEGAEIKDIIINDNPGVTWSAGGYYFIVWEEKGIIFSFNGRMEYEELIKIVNNFKIVY